MSELEHLKVLSVSDTGTIFDPLSGSSFSLDATGRCVLQLVKEGASRDQIVAKLRDRVCDARGEEVLRDLNELVLLLREDGPASTTLPPD